MANRSLTAILESADYQAGVDAAVAELLAETALPHPMPGPASARRRHRKVRRDPQAKTESVLVFRVGSVSCSVATTSATSVMPPPPHLTGIPWAPPGVAGVFPHLEGAVAAVCLRTKFGVLPEPDPLSGSLVLGRVRKKHTAFWVDEVVDIVPSKEFAWVAMPHPIDPTTFDWLLLRDESITLYTDFPRLFAMERIVAPPVATPADEASGHDEAAVPAPAVEPDVPAPQVEVPIARPEADPPADARSFEGSRGAPIPVRRAPVLSGRPAPGVDTRPRVWTPAPRAAAPRTEMRAAHAARQFRSVESLELPRDGGGIGWWPLAAAALLVGLLSFASFGPDLGSDRGPTSRRPAAVAGPGASVRAPAPQRPERQEREPVNRTTRPTLFTPPPAPVAEVVAPRTVEAVGPPLGSPRAASAPVEIVHVVEEGETLWALAGVYLGDPFRYPDLAAWNNIPDPHWIYPGDRVRVFFREP